MSTNYQIKFLFINEVKNQQPIIRMSKLSEKKIIKQLKCLVAKQQAQINTLLKQLAQMKINHTQSNCVQHQINQHYYYEQKDRSKSQSQIHHYNNHQDQYSQTFDDNVDSSHQNSMIQNFLNQLQNHINNFYQSTLQQMKHLYLHEQLPIQKKYLSTKFDNLSTFAQFFPNFISDIKDSFLSISKQIQKLNQQQISLSKKIISQQKTLNQIITEYQNCIKKSQIVEQKLLIKIQALQHNQAPIKHHQYLYQPNQNKTHKFNYSP